MQNTAIADESSKMSHFEQIEVSLLRKQNHNLFQTVNQLRHRLARLDAKSGASAPQVDSQYVHRVLKFLLTSFALARSAAETAHSRVPSRQTAEIDQIISGVLDGDSASEKSLCERIRCFVRGSLRLINAAVHIRSDEGGTEAVRVEGSSLAAFIIFWAN